MNCPDATRLLNACADGELDLAMALAVEEHLGSCARCRGAFASLQAVRGAIDRHAEFRTAPEALRAKVRASISGGRARRPWTMLRSPLAVAVPGIAALLLAGWLLLAEVMKTAAPPVVAQTRVVYHISHSDTAGTALRNLANHLQAAPEVKVVVVAHSDGVDFLLRGARDESGQPFEPAVSRFLERGVEFRVCNNTLERRGIDASQVIPDAMLVPSGIAEIGRLQNQEGYAYLRL